MTIDGERPIVASTRSEHRRHATRAFRHRNYRLYFVGQTASMLGSQMHLLAQGWLVLQLSGDPFMLGVLAVAQAAPSAFLGLFGPLVTDPLPKRRFLTLLQIACAAIVLWQSWLVFSGHVTVGLIILGATLLGIAKVFDSSARQALYVELVGHRDLPNLVGYNWTLATIGSTIGPALAGIAIVAVGMGAPFLINAATYVLLAICYLLMRMADMHPVGRVEVPRSVRGLVDNLAEGLAFARRSRMVLISLLTVAGVQVFGMTFGVIGAPLSQEVFGLDATGYGFLMGAYGFGSTVAALAVAFTRTIRTARVATGAIVLGIATLGLAASNSYPLALLAITVAGIGGITTTATANALIQDRVTDELRARVMSIYTTVLATASPIGGLIAGAIAATAGVVVALTVGGAACVVIGVVAWTVARPRAGPPIPARIVIPHRR